MPKPDIEDRSPQGADIDEPLAVSPQHSAAAAAFSDAGQPAASAAAAVPPVLGVPSDAAWVVHPDGRQAAHAHVVGVQGETKVPPDRTSC